MEQLGMNHKPHDIRHTCISLLAEAHVGQTMIKKIVGHAGAMSLTERVYTHLDIQALVVAINSIVPTGKRGKSRKAKKQETLS